MGEENRLYDTRPGSVSRSQVLRIDEENLRGKRESNYCTAQQT